MILISITSSERARAYQVRMILNSMKRTQSSPERGPITFGFCLSLCLLHCLMFALLVIETMARGFCLFARAAAWLTYFVTMHA
jgi:hypothetical protein